MNLCVAKTPLFFIKKSKIHLNFLISEEHSGICKMFPPVETRKTIPKWFKECPVSGFDWKNFFGFSTVKGCVGIRNYMTTGFVIPLWGDTNIQTQTNGARWAVAGFNEDSMSGHNLSVEAPGFYENFLVLKFNSPWVIKSSCRDLKLLNLTAQYQNALPLPFTVFQGISDLRASSGTNFFIGLPKINQNYNIPAGSVLNQWVPLTDKKIVIQHSVVSRTEFNKHKSESSQFSFGFSGVKRINKMRELNEQ